MQITNKVSHECKENCQQTSKTSSQKQGQHHHLKVCSANKSTRRITAVKTNIQQQHSLVNTTCTHPKQAHIQQRPTANLTLHHSEFNEWTSALLAFEPLPVWHPADRLCAHYLLLNQIGTKDKLGETESGQTHQWTVSMSVKREVTMAGYNICAPARSVRMSSVTAVDAPVTVKCFTNSWSQSASAMSFCGYFKYISYKWCSVPTSDPDVQD